MLLAEQSVFVVVTRLQGRRGGLRFARRTPWWGEGGSKGDAKFVPSLSLPVSCNNTHQSLISFTTLAPAWCFQGGGPYNPAPFGRHRRWKNGGSSTPALGKAGAEAVNLLGS